MKNERELFRNYVAVQYSGIYNMITEANSARKFMEASSKEYWYIIDNYNELVEKYPKEYEEGKKIGSKMCKVIIENYK